MNLGLQTEPEPERKLEMTQSRVLIASARRGGIQVAKALPRSQVCVSERRAAAPSRSSIRSANPSKLASSVLT